MRKLKIALVLITIIIYVISCGNNQGDDYPRPGLWVADDMFVNEWFGVQFQLPAGWAAPDPRQLEELLRIGTIVFEHSDIEMSDEILEAMEGGTTHNIYDMYAINSSNGSSVRIMFEQLPRNAENTDVELAIEDMVERMEQESFIAEVTVRSDSVFIGELEFHVVDVVLDMMSMSSYMSIHVNQKDRNLRLITINSPKRDEIDYIWGYFNVVGAERIESVAPEFEIPEVDFNLVEEDFIGIWEWDLGMNFVYEFFDDGTGTRGAPGVSEEFTWSLVDGELHLRLDVLRMELWVPTINENVLTITSLQKEGMSYSYTRR